MSMSRFKNVFVAIIFSNLCVHGSKLTWLLKTCSLYVIFKWGLRRNTFNSIKMLSKEFINHFL